MLIGFPPLHRGAPLQLVTKEDVGQLALAIGQPLLVEALAVQITEIDPAKDMRKTGDRDDAEARGAFQFIDTAARSA